MAGGSSSPPGGLVREEIQVDRLDIYDQVMMEEERRKTRGRSDSETEEIGSKRTKGNVLEESHRPNRPNASELEAAAAPGSRSDEDGRPMNGNKVVLIKFLDDKVRFTNPRELNLVLNKSPFHKYVVQYSVRNLGNGNGCRLEVNDPNGKMLPVEEIKKVDKYDVRCWHPSEPTAFLGKISPISTDVSIEYLYANLEVLNGEKAVITHLKRMRGNNGEPTMTIIIGTEGVLPKKVATDNVAFPVTKYVRPPLRCYKCHLFGHGTLTCESSKRRCVRCGDFHENLQDCTKNYFCIFCKGNHRYSSRECPVNVKAWDIEYRKNTNQIEILTARKEFRELNRLVKGTSRPSVGIRNGNDVFSNSRPVRNSNEGAIPKVRSNVRGNSQQDFNDIVVENLEDTMSEVGTQGSIDEDYSARLKSRSYYRSRKHRSSPNRSRKEWPRLPSLQHNIPFNHTDNFNVGTSLASSEIYHAQLQSSGGNEGIPKIQRTEFIDRITKMACEIFDIYNNGKSFSENFFNYFNIVGNFVRTILQPSI